MDVIFPSPHVKVMPTGLYAGCLYSGAFGKMADAV